MQYNGVKKNLLGGAGGFREMNTPQKPFGYNDSSPKTGVEYVIDEFKNKDKSPMPSPGNSFVADTPVGINPLYNENQSSIGSVKTKFGFPTVLTVWNSGVFGELKVEEGEAVPDLNTITDQQKNPVFTVLDSTYELKGGI